MSSSECNDVTISCLQHAIEDTQGTIRAYDSKAEILAILLTVALGITNFTLLQEGQALSSKCLLGASWVVGLIALGLLGRVLLPKKNLTQGLKNGEYAPSGTYFLLNVLSCPQNTVSEVAKKATQTDWVSELTYESMKLSLIRDYKHGSFMSALWAAGAALLLVVITVVVEVVAWQPI